jgi:hypothetical protein
MNVGKVFEYLESLLTGMVHMNSAGAHFLSGHDQPGKLQSSQHQCAPTHNVEPRPSQPRQVVARHPDQAFHSDHAELPRPALATLELAPSTTM